MSKLDSVQEVIDDLLAGHSHRSCADRLQDIIDSHKDDSFTAYDVLTERKAICVPDPYTLKATK